MRLGFGRAAMRLRNCYRLLAGSSLQTRDECLIAIQLKAPNFCHPRNIAVLSPAASTADLSSSYSNVMSNYDLQYFHAINR